MAESDANVSARGWWWMQLEKLPKDKDVMHDSKVHWFHVHAHLKHKAMGGMKEKCP